RLICQARLWNPGGIAGGAGYALTGGDQRVAETIWRSSLGGNYVITTDMITGEQPVHFSGPTSMPPMTNSDIGTRGVAITKGARGGKSRRVCLISVILDSLDPPITKTERSDTSHLCICGSLLKSDLSRDTLRATHRLWCTPKEESESMLRRNLL